MAGPGFMSRQGPGSGGEIEVVKLLHLAGLIGNIERKDELTDLARVAEKSRRLHVGRGGGGTLGLSCDPDPGLAIRQGQDLLVANDLLDLLQSVLVVCQDGVADELVFLEGLDDVTVVGRGQPLFAWPPGRPPSASDPGFQRRPCEPWLLTRRGGCRCRSARGRTHKAKAAYGSHRGPWAGSRTGRTDPMPRAAL